jgi:Zn-dependent protease with chaperone function
MDRCFLQPDVAREEHRRRLAICLSLAVLSLLAFGPVLSHLAPEHARAQISGYDHVGAVCLHVVHALLAPVHGLFHVLLGMGLCYATWDRVRAWTRQRALLRALPGASPAPDDTFGRAALVSGIDPRRLVVVDGLPTPALTVGLLAPRILVARAIAHQLTAPELVAVLAHEAAHLRRRDPLRVFLLRFLARTLFWLPVLERLSDAFLAETEVLADDHAARATTASETGRDGSLVLASALVSLAAAYGPHPVAEPAIGIHAVGAPGLFARRVRRLAGEAVPVRVGIAPSSVLSAFVALVVVWLSILPVLHAVPEAAPGVWSERCGHHR